MALVRFEPTISASERPQTYALDRAATGTGNAGIWFEKNCEIERLTPKYIQIKVNGNILIF
jgi:hypothetical protein